MQPAVKLSCKGSKDANLGNNFPLEQCLSKYESLDTSKQRRVYKM